MIPGVANIMVGSAFFFAKLAGCLSVKPLFCFLSYDSVHYIESVKHQVASSLATQSTTKISVALCHSQDGVVCVSCTSLKIALLSDIANFGKAALGSFLLFYILAKL